jgi:hypothetical protein
MPKRLDFSDLAARSETIVGQGSETRKSAAPPVEKGLAC